jgi:hypothetical protein
MGKEKRMAKIAASFEQEDADAVVAELARMNVDGLKWRVDDAGDEARGVIPVAVAPAHTAGTGTGSGAPAVAAPFFAGDADGLDDVGTGDEEAYLRQARRRGATVITVDVPSEFEATVRRIFESHSASNVVTT